MSKYVHSTVYRIHMYYNFFIYLPPFSMIVWVIAARINPVFLTDWASSACCSVSVSDSKAEVIEVLRSLGSLTGWAPWVRTKVKPLKRLDIHTLFLGLWLDSSDFEPNSRKGRHGLCYKTKSKIRSCHIFANWNWIKQKISVTFFRRILVLDPGATPFSWCSNDWGLVFGRVKWCQCFKRLF